MCVVWLLSVLIDEYYRNGHRLPAAYSQRRFSETWLHTCRHDSFVAPGDRSSIRVEQWHDKAGTRKQKSYIQVCTLTFSGSRLLRILLRLLYSIYCLLLFCLFCMHHARTVSSMFDSLTDTHINSQELIPCRKTLIYYGEEMNREERFSFRETFQMHLTSDFLGPRLTGAESGFKNGYMWKWSHSFWLRHYMHYKSV